MAKITYTNERGDSIVLGQSAPFFVTSLEGFSNVVSKINTMKSPNQDGETEVSSTLDSRHMVIQGEYLYHDRQEGRNKLIRVFNPKLQGELVYENSGIIKSIKCRPEKSPAIPSTTRATVPYMINLLAPNPFWLDDFESSDEIVTWTGGLRFPLRLPTTFSKKGPKKINIINNGDVETPVKINFKGPATNPKIINHTTGEYIQVNRTLLQDDILIITTDFGNKRVEINGENVFNWIDLGSKFWQLEVGDNIVEYTSDDEVENATVKIAYRNRYIGV